MRTWRASLEWEGMGDRLLHVGCGDLEHGGVRKMGHIGENDEGGEVCRRAHVYESGVATRFHTRIHSGSRYHIHSRSPVRWEGCESRIVDVRNTRY